jgi:hypothetical protein
MAKVRKQRFKKYTTNNTGKILLSLHQSQSLQLRHRSLLHVVVLLPLI